MKLRSLKGPSRKGKVNYGPSRAFRSVGDEYCGYESLCPFRVVENTDTDKVLTLLHIIWR